MKSPKKFSDIKHILLEKSDLSYYATCDRLRAHIGLDEKSEYSDTHNSDIPNSAYVARSSKPERFCNFCKKTNHLEESCFKKMSELKKIEFLKDVNCSKCNKSGHFSKDCNLSPENETAFAEEVSLMACVNGDNDFSPSEWVIDSGCSNHMCTESKLIKSGTFLRKGVKMLPLQMGKDWSIWTRESGFEGSFKR